MKVTKSLPDGERFYEVECYVLEITYRCEIKGRARESTGGLIA